MACNTVEDLTRNLIDNCKPVGQGLNEKIYILQRSQLLAYVLNTTNDKIIDSFTLKTGEKLKLWVGSKLSSAAGVGFAANDNGNTLPHTFRFMVFDNSPEADKEIDRIVQRTDLVAFVRQNGEFGRWKAMGWTTGLKVSNVTSDSNDANNPGQYLLEFNAEQERQTPKTLKHVTSSLEDTDTFLAGLALTVS